MHGEVPASVLSHLNPGEFDGVVFRAVSKTVMAGGVPVELRASTAGMLPNGELANRFVALH